MVIENVKVCNLCVWCGNRNNLYMTLNMGWSKETGKRLEISYNQKQYITYFPECNVCEHENYHNTLYKLSLTVKGDMIVTFELYEG